MAKNTSRISRFRIGTHVVIQIVAMAIVVLGVNYLGFHYYVRGDFSRSQKFSLSDQTKRVMKQLEKPATIIVYFSPTSLTPDSALYPDVNALLRELQFSAKKNLTVEFVNPTRNFARARDLQNQYKFGANENVVIVDYDGRSKFLPVSQMAVWQENVLMGDTPQVKEFKGEQVLTTAFLELIKPETRKIYFLQGHGEPTFAPTPPLSILRDYIIRQGLTAEPLNLAALDAVPEDAGALVIISPQSDPAQREMEIIKAFWEKNGAVYVALEPGMDTPLIQAFLVENGIRPLDNRVLRTVSLGFATGILRDVTTRFIPGSQITKRIEDFNGLFTGATQSLQLENAVASVKQIVLRPLAEAAEGYWGETKYAKTDGNTGMEFDAGTDAGPPLVIAASAERGGVKDDRVELGGSKLVVVGNSTFLTDPALSETSLDFFLSAMNWMLDRGSVAGVAPKSVKQFQLNLTEEQLGRIMIYTMVVLPGIAAILGVFVWLRRRA